MEYELNDIVEMKKQHPCDNNIMMPRREFNKKIKKIVEKHS